MIYLKISVYVCVMMYGGQENYKLELMRFCGIILSDHVYAILNNTKMM